MAFTLLDLLTGGFGGNTGGGKGTLIGNPEINGRRMQDQYGTGYDGGPGVLPNLDDSATSTSMGLDMAPPSSLPNPNSASSGKPEDTQAQVNQMRAEGNALMGGSQRLPVSMAPIQKPSGDPRNLMNFTGLLDNPNVLTRLGAGYNMGGLLGALGYAMTDMNPNSAGNTQQAQMTDEARRYAQQNRLSL